ncbi:MAG: transglycosylase SLT domain-containing protein, partial [Gemmatimonadota bacterium]|nr:transglycosylase SLT domain-containing protein [Gemmatimonadota bacterium]
AGVVHLIFWRDGMEFRSALPVAVFLGGVVGLAAAGVRSAQSGPAAVAFAEPAVVTASEAPEVSLWDIPVVWNAPVERFVKLFTGKQSDRMALYLKRSGRYEGMIRSKLRERGMPEDLLYLSMIESGFNPTARSKAQAVGLWQFIADTGRRYGLRVDEYVDERRDPEKSTDAALRYLNDLYSEFGSWYLAAAAYNTGEGRVRRVMREETGSTRGKDADFWRIRGRLPAETREYVPLMVAAALVGKEPHKYELDHVKRWLPVKTDVVEVPSGISLEVVARAVGADEKELRALNPQLVRGITPPGKKTFGVRIPEGRTEKYAANFERIQQEARAAEQARLAKLEAERKLAAAKAKKEQEAKLAQAKQAAAAKKLAQAKSKKQPAKSSKAKVATHSVKQGESLSTIAQKKGVTVAALQRANRLGKSSRIRAGQRLTIPG